jgi:hypothetical protein
MFLGLQDALGAVRPQQTWPRRYKALLLIAIALGIGTIVSALSDLLLAAVVSRFDISAIIVPLRPDSPWRKLFTDARKYLYLMGWLWRLFLGMLWGAPWVRSWLLSAWPSIELDFGPPHLHKEKTKRQRLLAVATLVVLPILVNVIYDLGKSFAK